MIGLLRILLLIALVLIIWNLARRLLSPPHSGGTRRGDPPRFEPTQRCTRCGTHVPRDQLNSAGLCQRCEAK